MKTFTIRIGEFCYGMCQMTNPIRKARWRSLDHRMAVDLGIDLCGVFGGPICKGKITAHRVGYCARYLTNLPISHRLGNLLQGYCGCMGAATKSPFGAPKNLRY
jgi:hypothetical protein